jgi:uncharacterized protein (DUF362 family)
VRGLALEIKRKVNRMTPLLSALEAWLRKKISRAAFLKAGLAGGLALLVDSLWFKAAFAAAAEAKPRAAKKITTPYHAAVAKGPDPFKNTVAVIEALGGMKAFVKPGSVVVIKPNIGWDRSPEQAANTNPEVVAALVELAYQAKAKRVNVFDVTCNDERRCYENSGIRKAAEAKGAKVYFADQWNVVKAKFPYPSSMAGWPILRDAVVCDTFINVPVLKHHRLTGLTLSLKNLMGVCTGTRGLMHQDIAPKLADLLDFIKPELTVIDATRVLFRNGPVGGNLEDVNQLDTVLASPDPVLADAYACHLLGQDPLKMSTIQAALARKLGQADVRKANVRVLEV